MSEFRLLKAEEIEVRVGQVYKGKASLLLYKDARCDMAILDEVYGGRWQRDHKEVKGNMYAGVGFWDAEIGQWIWRWDCGVESNTEKEKGEASDAFKRACVNLGIGRELYTAPLIIVAAETVPDGNRYKLADKYQFSGVSVKTIEYDNTRKICALEIVDKKGNTIYTLGGKAKSESKTTAKRSSKKTISLDDAVILIGMAEEVGSKPLAICEAYGVNTLEAMTVEQYEDCIKKLKIKKERMGK